MAGIAKVICKCGKEFETKAYRLLIGKGKYCSRICKYRYHTRASGLNYSLKVINKSWIKKGEHLSRETQFSKEIVPWNKGIRTGITPANFKGYDVGYNALHAWVRSHRGRPQVCVFCSSTKSVQWANKSHEYKRELDDWLPLCVKCHSRYDKDFKGAKERRFLNG